MAIVSLVLCTILGFIVVWGFFTSTLVGIATISSMVCGGLLVYINARAKEESLGMGFGCVQLLFTLAGALAALILNLGQVVSF